MPNGYNPFTVIDPEMVVRQTAESRENFGKAMQGLGDYVKERRTAKQTPELRQPERIEADTGPTRTLARENPWGALAAMYAAEEYDRERGAPTFSERNAQGNIESRRRSMADLFGADINDDRTGLGARSKAYSDPRNIDFGDAWDTMRKSGFLNR